ncbi:leucyl/phenylalanyl-tRNA--protein transferase [Falsirhodobacter sp. 20TX0035]|uniref:leucyl/phenylalanyl-tRNA--protein transferase n=1 Tax=Falsirhodobacter sp. 20TX0035 TaxID=3022019 RepID=UPI00232AD50B|nr:leucyl/phenylalanyl-tRNA--protein transferase [Falsirhodobacter sp. 20TX0035]MDB6453459.1 leucyl/phenylalanyl-tRNA--protein transferase [Falsirhodobacter sp. 20TX0035]
MLTPDLLLRAYAMGIFPMADSRDDPDLRWIEPQRRGMIPLDGFHISTSLCRHLLKAEYEVHVDRDFSATVRACAARDETWISHRIEGLYRDLHNAGHAHSVEVWSDGRLIGGTYGVTLGAAFFGESMFSHRTNGSKVALAWLVHRLNAGGFRLFDTQFLTPHLASLGGQEIGRARYQTLLRAALRQPAEFLPVGYAPTAQDIVQPSQSRTQTS